MGWKLDEDKEYAMMFGEATEETEEKDPPMKRVPLAGESLDTIVEFDQHIALIIPPALVLPNT